MKNKREIKGQRADLVHFSISSKRHTATGSNTGLPPKGSELENSSFCVHDSCRIEVERRTPGDPSPIVPQERKSLADR